MLDPLAGPIIIPTEGGFQLGLTAELEVAVFTGPGTADAQSFKGMFFTAEGSVNAPYVVSVGLSGYQGVPDPVSGAYWFGGTLSVGLSPIPFPTGGTVAYRYQFIDSYTVPFCPCLAIIAIM